MSLGLDTTSDDPPARPGGVAARARTTRAPRGLEQVLDERLERAQAGLLALQRPDGHWCFPLEADCTIPAEYILMMHFIGSVDADLQEKIATYLRRRQAKHGGWPLYHGGQPDISCTVKVYWALKLAGDSVDAAHMRRARETVHRLGGAARCNVFTRITMALFGQIPWRGVPWVPVEMILVPSWFPLRLSRVSYWSRTVVVPLSILCSLRARAQNPTGTHIRELFLTPPEEERDWFPVRSRLNHAFLIFEKVARRLEPLIPRFVRRRAVQRALEWTLERRNGENGLGAIFPAMVNALEVLCTLGYAPDDPVRKEARRAIDKLLVLEEDEAWCQPCVSPVWDTALAALALNEQGRSTLAPPAGTRAALERAGDWLVDRQVVAGPADWRESRPSLEPGGWAFQYGNSHYPDLDDTSMVVWALLACDPERHAASIERAVTWLVGMQSKNGGFASFDADNTLTYLNHIPFADHGALLDPPTSDVTARCLAVLGMLERPEHAEVRRRCLEFLWNEQEANGSWYGRWGTNYIYGTWSVLAALEHVREGVLPERVQRAADWLASVQQEDGSFGESCDTYARPELAGRGQAGTPYQTAWALLGLMAAGRAGDPAVRRGVDYLLRTQGPDGLWSDEHFTAPGFPRVFYLRYHGYAPIFPLWALARYRNHLRRRR